VFATSAFRKRLSKRAFKRVTEATRTFRRYTGMMSFERRLKLRKKYEAILKFEDSTVEVRCLLAENLL